MCVPAPGPGKAVSSADSSSGRQPTESCVVTNSPAVMWTRPVSSGQ